MPKGKRQRANAKSPKKVSKITSKISVPSTLKEYPVRTLNAADVNQLQQLVGLSNSIVKLQQQCSETDKMISQGNEAAKDMLKGKIKGPVLKEITPRLYVPITDTHSIANKMKVELSTIKKMNDSVKVQLTQQYDGYLASMQNVQRLFEQLLVNAPKLPEPQVIFEKDISKITKKDKAFIKKIKADIDKKARK